MDQRIEELKHLVSAKKKELEARLERAKADAHGTAGDAGKRIRGALDELEQVTKSGWERLGDEGIKRLNDWLHKN